MKKIEEPGIILSTTAVREADLVVTLLGQSLGKLTAFAFGARRSKKRFPGGIDDLFPRRYLWQLNDFARRLLAGIGQGRAIYR